MDISDKIREFKEHIGNTSAEEKLIRNRISELKQLIIEKRKREDALAELKKEEEELMKQLME